MKTILLTMAMLVAVSVPVYADAQETTCISLYSTASTKAALRDCGCPKKPLGGLARRATLLNQVGYGGFLVDAGNWSDSGRHPSLAKSEMVLRAMASMGYSAVTPGAGDLVFGRDDLARLYAGQPGIKVVSANIRNTQGQLFTDEYQVFEINGVSIGVTGVTGSAGYAFNLTRGRQVSDDFRFDDPADALLRVLPGMREKVDLVVVLASLSPVDTRMLAETVPGMDVVVVGQNPTYTADPEMIGEALVISGGSKGKYLSRLDMCVNKEGSIVGFEGQGLEVHPKLHEAPEIARLVDAWEAQRGSR